MEGFEADLSIGANNIVSTALQLTSNLFCPYCADAYMFEFTLKDHLKKSHQDILVKHMNKKDDDVNTSILSQNLHNCPYCGAMFVHLGLIPKHISNYHGNDLLKIWQRQEGNLDNMEAAKKTEPSILYAACSPGLSDIFDNMHTDECTENLQDTTQLKSILKKTSSKHTQIICSPSSAAIRRCKSEAVKRSVSVRRELRFDPTTKKSPTIINSPKKQRQKFKLKNPFARKLVTTKQPTNKIITSTPINFLDDDLASSVTNKKQWKATIYNNRPLFFCSEKFQCARCKKTWNSNAELLIHLRDHHKSVRHWLRPQYRCGLCGATFYSNRYLIKHCHMQHTPKK